MMILLSFLSVAASDFLKYAGLIHFTEAGAFATRSS